MKSLFFALFFIISLASCSSTTQETQHKKVDWDKRTTALSDSDTLMVHGETYLSVYSQIYSIAEHRTHDLTATVSLRNTDKTDTLILSSIEYFDTHGTRIRSYVNEPIFIAPMETLEIVVDGNEPGGGTGGNFLFDWHIPSSSNEPIFEAVMISNSGQQGLSFSTQGQRLS